MDARDADGQTALSIAQQDPICQPLIDALRAAGAEEPVGEPPLSASSQREKMLLNKLRDVQEFMEQSGERGEIQEGWFLEASKRMKL